ncbi:terminal nucleotidyltransferase 4B-like [Halichondria panicea]|uniref:terminal nucleotidyltransferase 4B-like n=1 Tax=Halichondria panicea TaxID=6063 RepID=UPI00312B3196
MASTTTSVRHTGITPASETWAKIEETTTSQPDYLPLGSVDVAARTDASILAQEQTIPSMSKRKKLLSGESTKTCTPWKTKDYPRDPPGLHEEISDCYEYLKPRPSEIRMRADVITRVAHIIKNRWPHAVVSVFGSVCNNLFLPTSDIDLVVLGQWAKLPLFSLEEDFVTADIAVDGSILVLDKTSIPIIRFIDKVTEVKVDISFNRDTGIESARMITSFIHEYPALPKLALVIKQFLTQRNLNEVFYGGISSYSIILLIVNFLQVHPRYKAADSDANLGVLLIEFFELYGRNFNYMKTGITVLDGGSYFDKNDLADDRSMLFIIDPTDPKAGNASRGCYGMWQVKQSFEQAFLRLHTLVLTRDNPTPKCDSLLSSIIQVSAEVDEYRNWVDANWPAHPLSPQASSSPYFVQLGPLLTTPTYVQQQYPSMVYSPVNGASYSMTNHYTQQQPAPITPISSTQSTTNDVSS